MLSRRRIAFTTRDIFKEPLSPAEIRALARLTPGGVRDLLSTRSPQYRALGLDQRPISEDALIALMTREPRLLRRPLVVAGDRLVIGFDRAALGALG